MERREFLKKTGALVLATGLPAGTRAAAPGPGARPNVIIVLADDMGYGDLSCHGNPVLRTPHLDRLHDESVRLTDFHAAPVCTPTRSQLMTGRDSLATGAYCICSGHGFIRRGIPTMADLFAAGGYRTGIFGKWHLGESYPYRPEDRGFGEVLIHGGWGITSTLDAWDNEYMSPVLRHNGRRKKYEGYCTDVFFGEAMKWMRGCAGRGEPFLTYLATNVPHGPAQAPDEYRNRFKGKTAGFFGMIANLDDNIGRLENFLEETGLRENTIVVFMTDNGGTGGVGVHNAGMKGGKASYTEGGHRVPCFVRWPAGRLRAPGDVGALSHMQDCLPTLLDLCGLGGKDHEFDGASLAPILRGQPQPGLDERTIVVQCALWEEYQGAVKWAGAAASGKWRLVKGEELYDLREDPGQARNVAGKYPDIKEKLRAHYERWWSRVEPLARPFEPIHLGSEHEEVTALNCHDWVAPNTANQSWIREGVNRCGPWHVEVERAGSYEIELRRWPAESGLALGAPAPAYHGKLANYPAGRALPIALARLDIAGLQLKNPVNVKEGAAKFLVQLPAGRTTLQAWFDDARGNELCGAYFVYVKRNG